VSVGVAVNENIIQFDLPVCFQQDLLYISENYCAADSPGMLEFKRIGFHRSKFDEYDYDELYNFVNNRLNLLGFMLVNPMVVYLITTWPGQAYTAHQDDTLVVHVPITTNPHCRMLIGDNTYHLTTDNFYLTNTYKCHSAFNLGTSPRTHIVFSAKEKS